MKALPTYEIRIAGRADKTTFTSFAGLAVSFCDEATVITGQFDQAALHGLLEMIRSLGLDLLEARRIDASPPGDVPGATDPEGDPDDQSYLQDQGHRLARPGDP